MKVLHLKQAMASSSAISSNLPPGLPPGLPPRNPRGIPPRPSGRRQDHIYVDPSKVLGRGGKSASGGDADSAPELSRVTDKHQAFEAMAKFASRRDPMAESSNAALPSGQPPLPPRAPRFPKEDNAALDTSQVSSTSNTRKVSSTSNTRKVSSTSNTRKVSAASHTGKSQTSAGSDTSQASSGADTHKSVEKTAKGDSSGSRSKHRRRDPKSGSSCENTSGGADVAIIHASEFSLVDYLTDFFLQMKPKKENSHRISVKEFCVEGSVTRGRGRSKSDFKAAKGAHIQLVLMSSNLVRCCGDAFVSRSLKDVLVPRRILCLLLGGLDESRLRTAQLSGLGSPSTWRTLRFDAINLNSISELLEEMVKVLEFLLSPSYLPSSPSCRSSSQRPVRGRQFRKEVEQAKFQVIPSRLFWEQTTLTVLLETEILHEQDVKIQLHSERGIYTQADHLSLLNPYAVGVAIPDSIRLTSGTLSVTVDLFDVSLGSRKVKVETRIDSLKAILESFTYPLEVMSLSMGVSTSRGDLDDHLSELLKGRIPPSSLGPRVSLKTGLEYPSWTHFSAAHGLETLTWALFDLPGGEAALTIPNCRGLTPCDLALANGYFSLAQDLQKAEFLTELDSMIGCDPAGELTDDEAAPLPLCLSPQTAQDPYPSPSGSPKLPIPRSPSSSAPGRQFVRVPDSPRSAHHGRSPTGSSVFDFPSSRSPTRENGDRAAGKLSTSPSLSFLSWSPDAHANHDMASLLSAWRKRTGDVKTFLRSHHGPICLARRAVRVGVVRNRVGGSRRFSPCRGERPMDSSQSDIFSPSEAGDQQNLVEQFWEVLEAYRHESEERTGVRVRARLGSDLRPRKPTENAPPKVVEPRSEGGREDANHDNHDNHRNHGYLLNHRCRIGVNISIDDLPDIWRREAEAVPEPRRSPSASRRCPQPPPRLDDDDHYIKDSEINCPSVAQFVAHQHLVSRDKQFVKKSSSFCRSPRTFCHAP
ncbi:uncharacterized protein LOC122246951 [Penaeus japonicus]|uniref:uncharacterized protein LOC122246951 n=1 Tax=Penaeus japonicus TaxID=27405 RepID=UPI001C70D273|nr:uncharacterized protein LOC122246951 [Penaeus japonicus]